MAPKADTTPEGPSQRPLLWSLAFVLGLGCSPQPPAPPPAPAPQELHLVAVGDVLMHEDVKRAALQGSDRFRGLWDQVIPLFKKADLVLGNLETVVAPRNGRPGAPYVFNAPAELADDLAASGFTALSLANNHAFDQGPKSLVETLEHLERVNLVALGAGRTQAEALAPKVMTVKGFKVALLAYTDLFNANLNGRPDAPHVAKLEEVAAEAVLRGIRPQVDVVVVNLHWGIEYLQKPTERQRHVAKRLVAAGADLLLGHHPHVLGPLEWVEAGGRKAMVAFSLGNFISNQDRMYRPGQHPESSGDNRDSAALQVTFTRMPGGPVSMQARVEPLWTDNNWLARQSGQERTPVIRVYPLQPALEETTAALRALPQTPGTPDPRERELQARIRLLTLRQVRIRRTLERLELH